MTFCDHCKDYCDEQCPESVIEREEESERMRDEGAFDDWREAR